MRDSIHVLFIPGLLSFLSTLSVEALGTPQGPPSAARCSQVLAGDPSTESLEEKQTSIKFRIPESVLKDLKDLIITQQNLEQRNHDRNPLASGQSAFAAHSLFTDKIAALEKSYGRREVRAALKELTDSFQTVKHDTKTLAAFKKKNLSFPREEDRPKRFIQFNEFPQAQVLLSFTSQIGGISSTAVAKDSSFFVTTGHIVAKLWKTDNTLPIAQLKGHSDEITQAVFSPNDQFLITGSKDHLVKVWDGKTGSFIRNLIGHDDAITFLQLTSKTEKLITGSLDGTIKVWSPQTGANDLTLTLENGAAPLGAALSPDENLLACWTDHSQILIFDINTGIRKDEMAFVSPSPELNAHWSPDSQSLMTSTKTGRLHIWQIPSGELIHDLSFLRGDNALLSDFSKDGDLLFFVSANGWKAFSHTTFETPVEVSAPGGTTYLTSALSKDKSHLAIQDSLYRVHIYETQTGKLITTIKGDHQPFAHLEFSEDNKKLLVVSVGGKGDFYQLIGPTQALNQLLSTKK